MSDRELRIELSEGGLLGTVRDTGQPDLVAHLPEAWRFLRLARIVGASKTIAFQDIGFDGSLRIVEAMESISDLKGEFRVTWRGSKHRPEFDEIMRRALAVEREDDYDSYVDPST